MYSNLLTLLIPIFSGYLLPSPRGIKNYLSVINKLLGIIVVVILFLMSISLALLPNLINHLLLVSIYASISALCILTMNAIALSILDKIFPWIDLQSSIVSKVPLHKIIIDILKLCIIVILGFALGSTHLSWLYKLAELRKLVLMIMLCLIGIQLRNSNLKLRNIFINIRGIFISITVALSALTGGILVSLIFNFPIKVGLALSSSYGWYSLSSVLMTNAFGVVIGSTAFFNDLLRELLSMIFIPTLIQTRKNTALGLCGANSMDFILPILQRSGGISMVPTAIVNGFILSILAPILLTIFST